ncbi:MAG: DUF1553 domain-containing protein [Planctomycetota bacterium]|nr:DUF1553 domain-containing protein [Planctomycetota bacterium]
MQAPPSLRLAFLALGGGLLPLVAQDSGGLPPSELATVAEPEGSARVDYLRQVRPLLTQHCYGCHGPDEDERVSELRFDVRASLAEELDDGRPAVTPFDTERSDVWRRVSSKDPDLVMPPPKADDPLSPEQIEILRRWIVEGADWADHWAFETPRRPQVPAASEGWGRNSLDHFIADKHREVGRQPAAAADRRTLIRRLTFDLTGLPPTPQDVEAFVTDTRGDAYERLIDRLLESPRYGEHQAHQWLDLARYADSNGYQRDSGREAWKWRDWVIAAFNDNMPYDQFAVEQLAGDLLAEADVNQQIATGFNRNHPINSEAGEEPDEYRTQYVMDRVDTTATTFLGMTMACAQCHDHKFDPISQKDYYRFYAFFDQVEERDNRGFGGGRNAAPSMRVPTADQAPHVATLKARIDELEKRLEGDDPFADAKQADWEEFAREFVGRDVEWEAARPIGLMAHQGSVLERQEDGSILAHGEAPTHDSYDLTFKPGKRKITAIRLEVLPADSEEGAMSGRSRKGQFILSGLKLRLSSLSDATDPPLMFLAKAEADLNQERPEKPEPDSISPGDIGNSIIVEESTGSTSRGFGRRGWSIIGDERMQPHEAILLPLEPLDLNEASVLRVTLEQRSRPYRTLISRFRVSFASDPAIREVMLPAVGKKWSSLGPFPAKDLATAYRTEFAPEEDLEPDEPLDRKKTYEQPVVVKEDDKKKSSSGKDGKAASNKAASNKGSASEPNKSGAAQADKEPGAAAGKPPATAKPAADKPAAGKAKAGPGSEAAKPGGGKAQATSAPKAAEKKASGAPAAAAKKPDAKAASNKAGAKPGKPSGTKPGKPSGAKPGTPSGAKPGSAAGSGKPPEDKAKKDEKKPVELTWKEQESWRDGRRISLQEGNVAWYLTRKLHSSKPRVVTMQFASAPGVKAWLNGTLIYSVAPTETPSRSSRSRGGSSSSRNRSASTDRDVTVGLREGESELVVKLVYGEAQRRSSSRRSSGGTAAGAPAFLANLSDEEIAEFQAQQTRRTSGGGAFTFNMTPHGEDVINYETITALRELHPGPAVLAGERDPAAAEAGQGPSAAAADAAVEAAATDDVDPRTKRLREVVRKYYRSNMDTVGKVLAKELAVLEGELRTLEGKMPEALVMKDLAGEEMRKTHMFVRGDYKQKGEVVEPGVPAVLPPMDKDLPRNRLGLARWLVDPANPLTARVAVNRIWQQYFGRGFVATPEDFGVRGGAPSHPQLLDWLAAEFVESGWDLKRLHKLIVNSATYRQASNVSTNARQLDPDNVLLARGARQRLSAEMVRDNALAVSGLLVEEVGGPSVRPYQPPGLWEEVQRGQRYRRDRDDKQYRRGLYVYWKRGAPYPSMTIFDAAKREVCTAQRARTTTPLQALVLLNDPVYVEAAKVLGQRLLEEGGDDDAQRLRLGFVLCTGQEPDETQSKILATLLAQQRAHYEADEDAAGKLLEVGDKKLDVARHGATELAAWTAVGSALLNMDATIHR